MHRWQLVVTNLQSPRLTDPGQRALHDPANLSQAAAVRRPLPRQVVFDPPLPETLLIPRRPILPVPVQGLGPMPGAPAAPTDRRDVIHQVHRFQRFVAIGPGDAYGQRCALAIDQQVPFGAFFPRSVGFLPVRAPQKQRGSFGCPRSSAPSRCPAPARPAARGCAGASSRHPAAASTATAANR
jgi:hypothetical protein